MIYDLSILQTNYLLILLNILSYYLEDYQDIGTPITRRQIINVLVYRVVYWLSLVVLLHIAVELVVLCIVKCDTLYPKNVNKVKQHALEFEDLKLRRSQIIKACQIKRDIKVIYIRTYTHNVITHHTKYRYRT